MNASERQAASFSSPITTTARTLVAAIVCTPLLPAPPHTGGPSCASLRAGCHGGRVCASGYPVFRGKGTANQTTSHMKGSGGSV